MKLKPRQLSCAHATLVLISIFVGSDRVCADLLTFTDELSFLAAVDSPSLESFELVADRPMSTDPIVTASFTLVIESQQAEVRSSPTGGNFATDGEKYVLMQSQGSIIRFDLNVPATSGDGSEKGDHFGSQKVAAGSQKGGHLKAWFH